MTNTKVDIKNFLSVLDQTNSKNYAFHVYIPSLQKELPFLQINTAQQKTLIKSIIDSPIYNTEFIFAIRSIIAENCLDKSVKVDDLTLLDKLAICIALRCKSIGNKLESSIDQNGAELKYTVDLDSILDGVKDIPITSSEIIEVEGYKVSIAPPTIGVEYKIEKDIRSKGPDINKIQSNDQLRLVVGEAFITELVKYIQAVTVLNGEQEITVNFNSISSNDAIAILGKLPISVLENIVQYSDTYNKSVSSALKYKIPVAGEGDSGEPRFIEQEVQINGNFFIIS